MCICKIHTKKKNIFNSYNKYCLNFDEIVVIVYKLTQMILETKNTIAFTYVRCLLVKKNLTVLLIIWEN